MSQTDDDFSHYDDGYNDGLLNGRAEQLQELMQAFPELGMFHMPKSKEEATAWCELQGPQMTIGFMVALNYVHHQLQLKYDRENDS